MIRIGTSGWHYQHWQGRFYPLELAKSDWLAYYSQSFDTVEINNSFYHLPSVQTFQKWRETTPPDFLFAVKANRFITHRKKLNDAGQATIEFLEHVKPLGEKCGPILFQLPPNWRVNLSRLEEFLKILPEAFRYTFEFRDPSWFIQPVYELLREHNVAFCIYHLAGVVSPKEVTANFVYLRLHGPGGKYQGSYNDETLDAWRRDFSEWADNGKDIYCYFDNDQAAFAVKNALTLKAMLSK